MPRPKPERSGRRISIWLPPKSVDDAKGIENMSRFVQVCLEQAPDIMAWAILNRHDPKKYHPRKKLEDVIDEWNDKFPLDPLTLKRQNKWPKNSPKKPELW